MINLIPESLKEERKYGRRNNVLLTYSFSFLATAAAIVVIMIATLQLIQNTGAGLQQELDDATAEVAMLQGEVVEIERVATRFETAKKLNDSSIQFSELVPGIGAALPEGVVLNALSLTGGVTDPLVLDVDLRNADLAPVLLRNLTESELFEAADISSIVPRGGGEDVPTEEDSPATPDTDDTYSFTASVSASFTGTAETKRKAAAAAAAAVEAAAAEAAAAEEATQ